MTLSVLLFCALHQSPRSISGLKMQADDPLKLFVGGLPWALTSDDLREVAPFLGFLLVSS